MMKPAHVHGLNALHVEMTSLDLNVQKDLSPEQVSRLVSGVALYDGSD
jgi:hypothetical protein